MLTYADVCRKSDKSIFTEFRDTIHDIRVIIIKHIKDVNIIRSLLFVCKSWKIAIEKGFDYSYGKQLPLIFNYLRGYKQEVNRLLKCENVTPANHEIIRIAICYSDNEMLDRILKTPNLNLAYAGNEVTFCKYCKSQKELDVIASMTSNIIVLCAKLGDLNVLKKILKYNKDLIRGIHGHEIKILRSASIEMFHIIFEYIDKIEMISARMLIINGFSFSRMVLQKDSKERKYVNDYLRLNYNK
jgi:hypothetical protein